MWVIPSQEGLRSECVFSTGSFSSCPQGTRDFVALTDGKVSNGRNTESQNHQVQEATHWEKQLYLTNTQAMNKVLVGRATIRKLKTYLLQQLILYYYRYIQGYLVLTEANKHV